ncbi:uncharacterized protein N7459_009357 [Penicillium hispanicum]|uniref:uncharacterized protein n=1 Tax=Penicillium hispanicum TaxID=1080232 RepID=UPI0025403CD0|nr:uncharacterized protein N7459_009357 [Penicillium hispanicum]KAJ5569927.1 hypothetical protein N7459_009357 [Penicillium hispanicum]
MLVDRPRDDEVLAVLRSTQKYPEEQVPSTRRFGTETTPYPPELRCLNVPDHRRGDAGSPFETRFALSSTSTSTYFVTSSPVSPVHAARRTVMIRVAHPKFCRNGAMISNP